MALVPIAGDIAGGIVPGKIASWLEYRAQWNRALKKPILCVGCSNTYLLRPGEVVVSDINWAVGISKYQRDIFVLLTCDEFNDVIFFLFFTRPYGSFN